jgi:hypothetical protein
MSSRHQYQKISKQELRNRQKLSEIEKFLKKHNLKMSLKNVESNFEISEEITTMLVLKYNLTLSDDDEKSEIIDL